MIGATILFGSKYSSKQLLGASGAVLAIIIYSHVTIKEKERKPEEDTLPLVVKPAPIKEMKRMNAAATE